MPGTTTERPAAALHRQLRAAPTVPALLALAADLAPAACGFDRALVPTVRDHRLSAADSLAPASTACDALRRLLLAAPVDLDPETEETAHVRAGRRPARRVRVSPLADRLGLEHYVLAAVVPESTTLALLVVDRHEGPPSPADLERVDGFALLVGAALERLVLRERVAELGREVREFALVAQALSREALDAPVALDGDQGARPAVPLSPATRAPGLDVAARLTGAERRVATLLVEGRSNREIAAALVLSPETVKTHVARILRKVGAANRVEAASLLLRPDV